MKTFYIITCTVSLILATAIPSWSQNNEPLDVFWKDGLVFQNADGSLRIQPRGRVHLDGTAFVDSDDQLEAGLGDLEDHVGFRRARLGIGGLLHNRFQFLFEYDFAEGDVSFSDMYVGLLDLPLGNLKIGHFKEPFSLEELESSNDITFLERSLTNSLAPRRNVGIMLYDDFLDQQATWALGLFRETDDTAVDTGNNQYAATGRVTGLPWYANDGRQLLHLGLAYSYREPTDDTIKIRSRPENFDSLYFIDTTDLAVNSGQYLGGELALLYGPFSLQSEANYVTLDQSVGSNAEFTAAYLMASYILTGENRSYKRSSGTFGGVKPTDPFVSSNDLGTGAWEVALRSSWLDLNDHEIAGGKLHNLTLGLNWYMFNNARMMFNYILADQDSLGETQIAALRMQFGF